MYVYILVGFALELKVQWETCENKYGRVFHYQVTPENNVIVIVGNEDRVQGALECIRQKFQNVKEFFLIIHCKGSNPNSNNPIERHGFWYVCSNGKRQTVCDQEKRKKIWAIVHEYIGR